MSGELVLRFFLGGILVCAFTLLGEVWRPKTLAGIFGAAPSVALATLTLALLSKGAGYAQTELQTMMLGALALGAYSLLTAFSLLRGLRPTLLVTAGALVGWLVVAFGLLAVARA
jgi:hypothetical protein